MATNIEELRSQYFSAIINLSTREDITACLPSPQFSNYHELMNGIIELVDHEVLEYLEIAESVEGEEKKEYLIEYANASSIDWEEIEEEL